MIYYCTYLFYHHIVTSFCFISVDEGPGDGGAGVSSSSSSSSCGGSSIGQRAAHVILAQGGSGGIRMEENTGLDTPVPMDIDQPTDGESVLSE